MFRDKPVIPNSTDSIYIDIKLHMQLENGVV